MRRGRRSASQEDLASSCRLLSNPMIGKVRSNFVGMTSCGQAGYKLVGELLRNTLQAVLMRLVSVIESACLTESRSEVEMSWAGLATSGDCWFRVSAHPVPHIAPSPISQQLEVCPDRPEDSGFSSGSEFGRRSYSHERSARPARPSGNAAPGASVMRRWLSQTKRRCLTHAAIPLPQAPEARALIQAQQLRAFAAEKTAAGEGSPQRAGCRPLMGSGAAALANHPPPLHSTDDDIVLSSFRKQQQQYQQLMAGLQGIALPLGGDDAAVKKYAAEVESLKKKVTVCFSAVSAVKTH